MSFVTDLVGDVIGSITGSTDAANAGVQAGQLQANAAIKGVEEQKRQFDFIQNLFKPFVEAGTGALGQQQTLIGLKGAAPQQAAIDALKASPQFQSLLKSGNENILQNASATGGLRGGNTQGALAQFSPALLAQTINDQYSRLGGLTTLGQNSAANTGTAASNFANSASNLYGQIGAAQAGGALAAGNERRQTFQDILGLGRLAAGFF